MHEKLTNSTVGIENMREVDPSELKSGDIVYTSDPSSLATAKFIIIAVPTPVDEHNTPDLTIIRKASEMVGKYITAGTILSFESTVYPGVTEDICGPIIEKVSGLKCGQDFFLAYSPERVNPGDKQHTIENVVKVVSGQTSETLEVVKGVYGAVTTVYPAVSIRVAEAAKVIENTQRDLNIALMNELAVVFNKMGISVYDVLSAAETKWNFLKFYPGLVGGHCIGVDPYYLTYKAQELGHTAEVILAGRHINDGMHKFIAEEIVKNILQSGKDIQKCNFVMLGITFKENVKDVRNSKAALLYDAFKSFGASPIVYDPLADAEMVKHEYGIEIETDNTKLPAADVLVVTVAHDEFKKLSVIEIQSMLNAQALVADVKHIYNKIDIEKLGLKYWSL
jgi:UDP-N-acetyl-D-galactosamine dehydrogenase